MNHDARRRRAAGARLERVAQQVAERLAQQHLVAFDRAELAAHVDVAAQRARVGAHLLGGALADRAQIHARERQLRRAARSCRKFVTTWLSDSVSARMPSTYGRYGVGQRVEVEQLAVAVDRREAVAEFVRDAGGQLADGREAVLQPQLLLELLHRGQIGEQADRAVQLAVASRTAATR